MNWLSNQILANLIRSGPIRQSEYDNIFLLIHRKSYDTEIRNSGSNSDALSRLSKNSEIPRINGDENVDVLSYKKFAPEKNKIQVRDLGKIDFHRFYHRVLTHQNQV